MTGRSVLKPIKLVVEINHDGERQADHDPETGLGKGLIVADVLDTPMHQTQVQREQANNTNDKDKYQHVISDVRRYGAVIVIEFK